LTKAMIVERLLKKGIIQGNADAKNLVESFFETAKDVIVNEGELKLSRFGNFTCREKVARPGRNPKTLEPKIIAARRVCTFSAGRILKDRCEQPKK
ncbi:HU family DNA-binding protein, partial [Vibrio harveyi]